MDTSLPSCSAVGSPPPATAAGHLLETALAAANAHIAALESQLAASTAQARELQKQLDHLTNAGLADVPHRNPNPIVRLTAQGEITYANPAAADITQVLAADASGELLHQLLELAETAGAAGLPRRVLTMAARHYLCTAAQSAHHAGTTFYLTDITAQQQAEQQRALYETILEQVPLSLVVVDADFRYQFVNPAVEPDPAVRAWMLGKTNEEAGHGRNRPPAVIALRRQRLEQAVRERRDASWEEAFHNGRQDQLLLRNLRPIYGPDGSLRFLIGSGIDITERYNAEKRQQQSEALLREQQDFIRLIVDMLPNIVYVKDKHGEVTFHNAAFDKVDIHTEHRKPLSLLRGMVREQVQQLVDWRQYVMDTQEPVNEELPITATSGKTGYIRVHMRPVQRASGQHEVLVVITDITVLKQAKQAADANAQAKEDFLARMSHEIRTPLNGMLGMAMLLQKTPLTPAQQEYLATMQRSGQHLLALVNDVLDLAKITAHHLELDYAPFDVSVLLMGAGQSMAALATQKDLRLTIVPVVLATPRVLGDACRLHQVLLNLLSNALRFTERGSVRLGASLVGTTPEAFILRFWVEDTGIGIAPEQQERIFDSFAQASPDTSQRYGGTGLGLAISEQLVQQMGGTLRLCSVPGQGTTFSFIITLSKAPETETLPAPAAAPPAPTYEGLRGLRVLLAEDNLVNQWIARVLLEYWGVQVEAVATGTAALAQLSTQTFDAALLDIQMPGLSGVEVAVAIRQHADQLRANIPIIALTANAFAADRQHYLAVGMDGCITKPFEEAELCQMLLQLTHR
jgi:PAS domain S-box-containing protein